MIEEVNKIQYLRDLQGMFQTVSIAPTYTPKNLVDQIVFYKNGTTVRLYWYDTINATWNHVDATTAAGGSYSPSISPSLSPSISPSKSPSISPSTSPS